MPRGKNCRGIIFAPVLPLNYPHHEGILGTIWGTIFCPQIAYFQGSSHFKGQFEGQFQGHFQRGAQPFRKILVSVKSLSAILGPEMGASILWMPGENAFFLQEKPMSIKFHVLGLVAHDCGYHLSRYTCRATGVAADSWIL